jgi:hypothetical protein
MNKFNYASVALIGLIALVAVLRIGHILPYNFAPVLALCLLGSAYFTRKWMAFVFPASILLLSDLVIGVGRPIEMVGVYAAYLLVILIGLKLHNNVKPLRVLTITLSSSLLFFIITNFACWFGSAYYTQDLNGLIINYTGALPFYRNSLVSDMFFSGVFFTAFEMIKVKFPKFALVK